MRENQIKLQTQFDQLLKTMDKLGDQIGKLIHKIEALEEKNTGKIEALEEKVFTELKGYVQFKDISLMQKIIYGGAGTMLTFLLLAMLGLLIDKS